MHVQTTVRLRCLNESVASYACHMVLAYLCDIHAQKSEARSRSQSQRVQAQLAPGAMHRHGDQRARARAVLCSIST